MSKLAAVMVVYQPGKFHKSVRAAAPLNSKYSIVIGMHVCAGRVKMAPAHAKECEW